MQTAPTDIGVFPLNLVLVPGERVPLHIFEPRYRRLLADCTLSGEGFVIALSSPEGVAKIGCVARFHALGRRFADGRMNVLVHGTDRVEIVERTEGRSYLTAEVRVLADGPDDPDPQLVSAVTERFADVTARVTGSAMPPPGAPDVPLSYRIAGAIQLEPGVKQPLLEERDETARLMAVDEILTDALRHLDDAGDDS